MLLATSLDRVSASFQTRGHCATVAVLLVLYGRLHIDLLVVSCLLALITSAHCARQSTHRGTGACALARIACNRAPYRTQRSPASRTLKHMWLRGPILRARGSG